MTHAPGTPARCSSSPSTTRTCTFNVSPGVKVGTSCRGHWWRRRDRSGSLRVNSGTVLRGTRRIRDPQLLLQKPRSSLLSDRHVWRWLPATVDRPANACALRQRAESGRDRRIAVHGTRRYLAGRVYCGYSKSIGERLFLRRAGVAHDARHQPADRLQHRHRGHLPAGEHEVADRRSRRRPGVHGRGARPPLRTDRTTTRSRRVPRARGGHALVEPTAAGSEQEQRTFGADRPRSCGAWHQHHPRSPAERWVVDRTVRIGCRRPEILHAHVDEPTRPSPVPGDSATRVPSTIDGKIVSSHDSLTSRTSLPVDRS